MRFSGFALGVHIALGVLAAPLTSDAQQPAKAYRIGFLGAVTASGYAPQLAALRQGLRDLGYVEGKNIVIEYRWAEGKYDRLPALAAELARLPVDVIVTHGTPGTRAAKQATTTIPIVMAISGDAVAAGLVASLARPGGNLTGTTFFNPELAAKRLELLKEALPGLKRAAVLLNPDNPINGPVLEAMQPRAKALKVELHVVEVRGPHELEGAFSVMTKQGANGFVVLEDGMMIANVRRVAELAASKRLPGSGFKEYAEAGGFMAHAVNFPEIWRRAGIFIDKILKGAKPPDIPVEQATKFELVVNARAAKALGLKILSAILARANQIIQ